MIEYFQLHLLIPGLLLELAVFLCFWAFGNRVLFWQFFPISDQKSMLNLDHERTQSFQNYSFNMAPLIIGQFTFFFFRYGEHIADFGPPEAKYTMERAELYVRISLKVGFHEYHTRLDYRALTSSNLHLRSTRLFSIFILHFQLIYRDFTFLICIRDPPSAILDLAVTTLKPPSWIWRSPHLRTKSVTDRHTHTP